MFTLNATCIWSSSSSEVGRLQTIAASIGLTELILRANSLEGGVDGWIDTDGVLEIGSRAQERSWRVRESIVEESNGYVVEFILEI